MTSTKNPRSRQMELDMECIPRFNDMVKAYVKAFQNEERKESKDKITPCKNCSRTDTEESSIQLPCFNTGIFYSEVFSPNIEHRITCRHCGLVVRAISTEKEEARLKALKIWSEGNNYHDHLDVSFGACDEDEDDLEW